MNETPAVIETLHFPAGRRILAVSDIHGNLPYLRGLLEKLRFSEADELVVLGDIVEKGTQCLETLRYLMALAEKGNVHVLAGNCDTWYELLDSVDLPLYRALPGYMLKKGGLVKEMCGELGIPLSLDMDVEAMKREISREFAPEFAFLRRLPTIFESEHYLFVHGGLPEDDYAHTPAGKCRKCDNFRSMGRSFSKWVIVGHWPVVLYGDDIVNANPIIDRDRHIISIDGGCVLKDDGQLNALVIPFDGSEDFETVAYDPFPTATVLTAQSASERSAYFRWGDNRVRILKRGEEFSLCEHKRTGYKMEILTKYLSGPEEDTRCNDCTDYRLPLSPGDTVSVVETCSRGYFVKHRGISGWYFGKLDCKGNENGTFER